MGNVLVTGGGGFIGSHLINQLVRDHNVEQVVAVDNLRSGTWDNLDVNVSKVEKNIAELSTSEWVDLLAGIDTVFHLAAEKYNSPNSTFESIVETNIVATFRLVEAATISKCSRFVFSSSLYVYGIPFPVRVTELEAPQPITNYGMSKLAGEAIIRTLARETDLTWNIARLFFIYGPRQYANGGYRSVIIKNFGLLADSQQPEIRGDGRQELDYVYIDDCVDALIKLATHYSSEAIFNVASGNPLAINDLVREMILVSGRSVEPKIIPKDWTHGTTRSGSFDLINSQLGWVPRTDIISGLQKTWEHLIQ